MLDLAPAGRAAAVLHVDLLLGRRLWLDVLELVLMRLFPDGDGDDYMYMSTSSNNPGLYWENGTYDPYFLWTDSTDTLSIFAADTTETAEAMSFTTSQIANKLPTVFESAGDVSLSYDLVFTNTTAAYASFEGGPGYVRTSHASGNYDLTFSAANAGEVIVADDLDVEAEMRGLCHMVDEVLAGQDCRVRTRIVTHEAVVDGILEEANEGGYDLLVIGASNEWPVKSLLVGAVPDAIADRAPCSVLMVRRFESTGVSTMRRVVRSVKGW